MIKFWVSLVALELLKIMAIVIALKSDLLLGIIFYVGLAAYTLIYLSEEIKKWLFQVKGHLISVCMIGGIEPETLAKEMVKTKEINEYSLKVAEVLESFNGGQDSQ